MNKVICLTFRRHFKKLSRKAISQSAVCLILVLYANQFSYDVQLENYYLAQKFSLYFYVQFDYKFKVINASLKDMLFIIAKILISSHLCFLVYHNIIHEIVSEGVQSIIQINITKLNLNQRNAQFLNLYLNKMIAFCFLTSVIMVISKNLLPKLMTMLGILLWMYFGYLQQTPIHIKIRHYAEHTAILGGILYMAGSQYFQKQITLQDFKTSFQKAKSQAQEKANSKEKEKSE